MISLAFSLANQVVSLTDDQRDSAIMRNDFSLLFLLPFIEVLNKLLAFYFGIIN